MKEMNKYSLGGGKSVDYCIGAFLFLIDNLMKILYNI